MINTAFFELLYTHLKERSFHNVMNNLSKMKIIKKL